VTALVVACGSNKPPPARPVVTATVSSRCPELGKPDEVAAFDFAKEYVLSKDAAEKLKAAALAAIEVTQLNDKLDADLGIACSQIAHDLGDKTAFQTGNESCAAAVKDARDARSKLGSKPVIEIVTRAPLCQTDASLMTKCASICDSSVPAEKINADCEHKAGRCDGDCDGTCETKGAVKCAGSCSGTCEGPIKGECGGKCTGTCDGKRSSGACAGTCVGTCSGGPMSGECKGTCSGACKLAKPGICDGTCSGTCTVELADAKCAGEFSTPEVSTDCRARCELAAINKNDCVEPKVGLVITGARDREVAEDMKKAVDKSFGALLKTLAEVGDKGPKRLLNAQAVIEGARLGFKDMARSGGAATAAASQAQLEKCFDAPFKKAATAAAAAKTGLDSAMGVRDAIVK
jgi:hypothetical protein